MWTPIFQNTELDASLQLREPKQRIHFLLSLNILSYKDCTKSYKIMIDPKDPKKKSSGSLRFCREPLTFTEFCLDIRSSQTCATEGDRTVNLFDQLVVMLALTTTRLAARIMIDNALRCYSVQSRGRPCWQRPLDWRSLPGHHHRPEDKKQWAHRHSERADLHSSSLHQNRDKSEFHLHSFTTFRVSQILYRMSVYWFYSMYFSFISLHFILYIITVFHCISI